MKENTEKLRQTEMVDLDDQVHEIGEEVESLGHVKEGFLLAPRKEGEATEQTKIGLRIVMQTSHTLHRKGLRRPEGILHLASHQQEKK